MIPLLKEPMKADVTEWNGFPITAIVINADPCWDVMQVFAAIHDSVRLSDSELWDLCGDIAEEYPSYAVIPEPTGEATVVACYEGISRMVFKSRMRKPCKLLSWLSKERERILQRTCSEDNYLEGYLTPDFAAFVRQKLSGMGLHASGSSERK